ncbi:hypothetical protein BOX15_Mlig019641g1 [Macrostomum lignano]|uniref:VLIG-type G domain-containing protein n=1 Tax=Macrostomum lignano TaxID=282301 RepID=A0A267EK39_9PLAT|nr:hypothetical protein BOX15_Mlig019641g1 [Macrostomum lignano]
MAEGRDEDEPPSMNRAIEVALRQFLVEADAEKWKNKLQKYCMSVKTVPSVFHLTFKNDHESLAQQQDSQEDKEMADRVLRQLDEIKSLFVENRDAIAKVQKYQTKKESTRKDIEGNLPGKKMHNQEPGKCCSVDINALLEYLLTLQSGDIQIQPEACVRVPNNCSDQETDDEKGAAMQCDELDSQENQAGHSNTATDSPATEPGNDDEAQRSERSESESEAEDVETTHKKSLEVDSHEIEAQKDRQTQETYTENSGLREMVTKIGMSDWFPMSIPFTQIIKVVASNIEAPESLEPTQTSWYLLRQLFNYDGRAVRPDSSILLQSKISLQEEEEDNSEEGVNPIDALLCCYLCCDQEVQQILCKTLFACKLAFPLIYRDEKDSLVMSNWSLRDIILQFRDPNGQYVETSLVSDYPLPVVSFVRIGELPVSKSKLLNSLINGSSHETFFHRDCFGGQTRRLCSNGLVEATVFLPSKTSTSAGMARPFLTANLRGNVLEFDEQARLLAEVSHVIVVFVELEILRGQECLQSLRNLREKAEIILVVFKEMVRSTKSKSQEYTEEEKEIVASLPTVTAFSGRRPKAERELLSDLSRELAQKLVNENLNREIPFAQQLQQSDFDSFPGGTMKSAVALLIKIDAGDQTNLAQECLPLTALWLEYSQLLRKEYNIKSPEEIEVSSLRRAGIRNKQIEILKASKTLALTFAKVLNAASDCNDNFLLAKLYVQCIKLKLDEKSRKTFPALLERKRELVDKLGTKQMQERLRTEQQLKKLEKKLRSCSVGLEHLFREEGQLFEALQEAEIDILTDKRPLVNNLPKCFANLLMLGVPLEILDGDAGNIPSAWISAILKSCHELVGDKKIYVISVLGLQSSGKSTLLNTMFGLKFAVSAGRCTRGAFLQLVPVESGMPFDYVAVLDTEGLRAPELGLDKHHHDNELATLVIGLGDVTIINIKGENAAEMKDILQIAIHAFIRMKMANRMINIKRRCIFAHQNVAAAGAKEMMQEATFKMHQTLDDMTKETALGEGLNDVKRFGDILQFNRDTDIFFISDLLKGDPPMAPVNPGYSMGVQEVKQHLLHIFDREQKSYLGFSDFSHRVNDLWKAILSEDFVFSFRNSIERKAYIRLEKRLLKTMGDVEDRLEEWLQSTVANAIRVCSTCELIAETLARSKANLTEFLMKEFKDTSDILKRFFNESPYREYVLHFQEKTLENLKHSFRNLELETHRKMEAMCSEQREELEQGFQQQKWEQMVVARGNELTKRQKNVSAKQIREEFDKLWKQLESQFASQPKNKRLVIEKMIVDHLKQFYSSEGRTLDDVLRESPISLKPDESIENVVEHSLVPNRSTLYASIEGDSKCGTKPLSNAADAKKNRSVTVLTESKELVKAVVELAKKGSDIPTIHQMIRVGLQKLASEKFREQWIGLTNELEIRLTVIAFRFAFPHLVAMDRRFVDKSGQKAKLADSKERMWRLFESTVQGKCDSEIVAEYFMGHLRALVIRLTDWKVGADLRSRILNDLGRTKYHLIVCMLKDMADREDFDSLAKYIAVPYESAFYWLDQYINATFLGHSSQAGIELITIVKSLIDPQLESAKRSIQDSAAQSKSFQEWIEKLPSLMPADIQFGSNDLVQLKSYKSANLEEVVRTVVSEISNLKSRLMQHYSNVRNVKEVVCGETDLCSSVLSKIWGCKEQCPFCREPCCKSLLHHFDIDGSPHHCVQHRPQGVSGWHWVATREFMAQTCGSWLHLDTGPRRITFSCSACQYSTKPSENCVQRNFDPNYQHRYSAYRRYFPDWDIPPDERNSDAVFWKWFVWRFKEELERTKGIRMDRIPPEWRLVSKCAAIESLQGLI